MTKLSQEHWGALHVYCDQLAEALNDAGYDFKKFMEVCEYKYDVPFTKYLVKDQIWRPWQIYHTMSDKNPQGIISTTEITPYQALQIFEIVNQRVAEKTGVSVPWPCEDNRK